MHYFSNPIYPVKLSFVAKLWSGEIVTESVVCTDFHDVKYHLEVFYCRKNIRKFEYSVFVDIPSKMNKKWFMEKLEKGNLVERNVGTPLNIKGAIANFRKDMQNKTF